jgi:hypothetical protein
VCHYVSIPIMPRMARVVVPHYPHHVTHRGNHRQQTFFCDDDYSADLAFKALATAYLINSPPMGLATTLPSGLIRKIAGIPAAP